MKNQTDKFYRVLRGDTGSRRLAGASLVALLAAVAVPAPGIAKPVTRATEPLTLAPNAKAALTAMSAYLRSLKSFDVVADGTGDLVSPDGQTLEYGAQLRYAVALPDRMFAEISTGSEQRQIFYDGLKLTVSAPDVGYYTDVPLSGSLAVLLDSASTDYGVDLPLHQLFRWGDAKRPTVWPTSGFKVGSARCGTAICDQYAFREPGLDWQLWIEQGAKPLPVRVVYTGTLDKARPQIAANLTWTVDPAIPASRFAFTPAQGASRIAIKKLASVGGK